MLSLTPKPTRADATQRAREQSLKQDWWNPDPEEIDDAYREMIAEWKPKRLLEVKSALALLTDDGLRQALVGLVEVLEEMV